MKSFFVIGSTALITMPSIREVIGDHVAFLDTIFLGLESLAIDTIKYECDHLCYRVDTPEKYLLKKGQLAKHGELLSEAVIGGRLICTFLLSAPLVYKNRKIRMIELPNTKVGSPYPEGLEHAEFVIGNEQFSNFIQRHPKVHFDTRAMTKSRNADVSVTVGDRFTVKFHQQPLDIVIQEEKLEEKAELEKKNNNLELEK